MLICSGPNTVKRWKSENTIMLHIDNFWNTTQPGWLHNYVVDDAAGDQKVGGKDEGEDGPGGGSLK